MPFLTLILAFFTLLGGVSAQDVVQTVAAARALSVEEAAEGRPIKLTGVVTYLRDTEKDLNFNVHDTTGGVMVYPDHRIDLKPGQVVTVTGVTSVSVHGLRVTKATVVAGEMRGLPEAPKATIAEILDGRHEGSFVEVEAMVRVTRLELPDISPRRLALDLGSRNARLTVWVTTYDVASMPAPPGTIIRARGVPVRWKNPRGQTQSTSVLVNSFDDITVVAPAAPPEEVPLAKLQLWSGPQETAARARTTGTVTMHLPGEVTVVQEGDRAMRARAKPEGNLDQGGVDRPQIGDRITIIGFPVVGEYTVELEDAEFAERSGGAPPEAEELKDAAQMLAGPGLIDRDARFVSVSARVRDIRERDGRRALEMESGKHLFVAWLPLDAVLPDGLRAGSDVKLTGVCNLHLTDAQRRLGRPPGRFSLQLADAGGIQILKRGPWWNPSRLFAALGVAGGAILVLALWTGNLRKKNQLLRSEIVARERLERELAGERRRVAGELHDTLEQTLVAAALQLNAASRTLNTQPETAAGQMSLAHQLIARSRQEVRDAVWDLRLGEAKAELLSNLLERVCSESTSAGAATVSFETKGTERPIPALISAQILRVARESIANALKHGKARHVRTTVEFGETLRLTIADDGAGFDPATVPGPDEGHFGLAGMSERMQRVGGRMEIKSAPRSGATFVFEVPLSTS